MSIRHGTRSRVRCQPRGPTSGMIHLTYSNRTEELLAGFVGRAAAERQRRGPYAPLRLVVPNRNVETYVKFGLAEALGIAANLEVSFLRRLLADLTAQVVPGGRLVDAAEMEGHLLALLHDPAFLAAAELGPVREYLAAAGDSADALDRRRCQLAAELATLFDEYAASRPEMLRAWRERLTLADHPNLAGAERWQRVLWLALFGGPGKPVTIVGKADGAGGGARGRRRVHRGHAGGSGPGAGGPAGGGWPGAGAAARVRRVVHRPGLSRGAGGAGPAHRRARLHAEPLPGILGGPGDGGREPTPAQARQGDRGAVPAAGAGQPAGAGAGRRPVRPAGRAGEPGAAPVGPPGAREHPGAEPARRAATSTGRFVAGSDRGATTLLARLQDDILDRVVPPAPDPASARRRQPAGAALPGHAARAGGGGGGDLAAAGGGSRRCASTRSRWWCPRR